MFDREFTELIKQTQAAETGNAIASAGAIGAGTSPRMSKRDVDVGQRGHEHDHDEKANLIT